MHIITKVPVLHVFPSPSCKTGFKKKKPLKKTYRHLKWFLTQQPSGRQGPVLQHLQNIWARDLQEGELLLHHPAL